MVDTPRLGITLMASNDLQKEVIFNEAVIAFDALIARSAKDRRNTAPGSPALGDCYIVGAAPSGLWASKANHIAFWFNGWQFLNPTEKMKFYVESVSQFWTYTAPNWAADAAGTPTTLSDLSDVAATSPAEGDVLQWDGGAWVGGPVSAVADLADLGDVSFTIPPENGWYLGWNEGLSKWVPLEASFGAHLLGDLADVDMSAVDGGRVLTWDGIGNKAEWRDPPEATYNNVGALLDVDVSGVQVNDALVWNGSVWAPSGVVFNYSFLGMIDGPGTMEGFADHFLVVDPTESMLQYKSLADLLGESSFKLQDLADMPDTLGDEDVGKLVQVYKESGEYKFQYGPNYALPFSDGVTQLTSRLLSLRMDGFEISEPTEGNVIVKNANAVEYKGAGSPVGGPSINAINFTGSGVGVTNDAGTLVVTVSNDGGELQTLSDTNIVSPTDGQALVFDAMTGKWVNGEGASSVPEIDGEAKAVTYAFGPFAPPKATMFPNRFNAASADLIEVDTRGLIVTPGAQPASIRHSIVHRTVSNNVAPWVVTARIEPSSYAVAGHAAGIVLMRTANSHFVFLNIGKSTSDTQTVMRFGHVNASQVETITITKSTEYNWLRLDFDGNDIRAWVSNEGLIWHLFGTLSAAAVLGGPPTRIGIENRSNALHDGTVGALVTYWDDPDFPAASRTSNGVVSLGLSGLEDVDVETVPPAPGQALTWDNVGEKWVPGDASGVSSLSALTDVDLTAPPSNGQALVWNEIASKWIPGAGGGGGSGGSPTDMDISLFLPGEPEADEIVARHVCVRAFTLEAGFPDSHAFAEIAPSGTVTFNVLKNGVLCGTIVFASSQAGAFNSAVPVNFVAGDRLDIVTPSTVLGMSDVGITMAGSR